MYKAKIGDKKVKLSEPTKKLINDKKVNPKKSILHLEYFWSGFKAEQC